MTPAKRLGLLVGALALFVVVVAAVGVIRHRRRVVATRPRARVPVMQSAVVLPLLDPTVGPNPLVEAVVAGPTGRRASLWMTVDTGATDVTLPRAWADTLEVTKYITTLQVEDAGGRVVGIPAAFLPEVRLGSLAVTEVLAGVAPGAPVLGRSVLGATTWSVDWDRGTLTLGGPIWPEDNETRVVPLESRDPAAPPTIAVLIAGRRVSMVLDTGAFASAVPRSLGTALGLPMKSLGRPLEFHSAGGTLIVRTVFTGVTSIGDLELGRHDYASISEYAGKAARGLLGLDILSQYDFQVVPGQRVAFRPRRDLLSTAAERLGRWSWMPACDRPGCLRARLERIWPQGEAPKLEPDHDAEDARLTVTLEVPVGRSFDAILGCADEAIPGGLFPSESATALRTRVPAPRHLRVSIPSPSPTTFTTVMTGGAAWFRGHGPACTELTVLDAIPHLEGQWTSSADLEASITL